MNPLKEYLKKENRRIKTELARLQAELAQEAKNYIILKRQQNTLKDKLELTKRHNYRVKDINTKINKKLNTLKINYYKMEKHNEQTTIN